MSNESTSLDSAGVLRTDNGRFAKHLHPELPDGLHRYIRTSNRADDLLEAFQAANEHLSETNQASIDARAAGWGAADDEHYGDSIRLSMEYVRAQLDYSRAKWDLDEFRLELAHQKNPSELSAIARQTITDLDRGVTVTAEMHAQVMVAAETDESIAIDYMATWHGARQLSRTSNHPGRKIFLDGNTEKVRLIAIREGIAGTSPVVLAEIMSAYPTPEVSAQVRAVLRKSGFPGKAKVDRDGIFFGDTYFDISAAHRRYTLSQSKPNRMPGKTGAIYDD